MHIDLHDIVTEDFQSQMQNSFARLSGFGVVFTDKEGRHIGKGGNFTRFCQAINCREDGTRCCAQTNRQAIQLSLDSGQGGRPAIFVCHAGLVNIELPIMHNNECLGAFTAGQVICEEDCYPKDTLVPPVDWLSDRQLAEYYREIPVLSRAHIENTAELMCDLAQYMLDNYTYQLMQQELSRRKEELLLYEKRQMELEHQLTQTKFDALQRQVMPHFIFNVLNSVSRLISLDDTADAQQMLAAFTQMMRYNLSNPQTSVTLAQELAYVRNYLAIQEMRFGARLQCEIICDSELGELDLPFFSLQPLVENSLEHGILPKGEGGRVTVRCTRLPEYDRIEVSDDGAGIEMELLRQLRQQLVATAMPQAHEHVGLYNCYNRLKLMYGMAVAFEIDSAQGRGTRVSLSIPRAGPTG